MAMKQLELQWQSENLEENQLTLRRLRTLIPVQIKTLSIEQLVALAHDHNVIFPYELASYIKQNK